MATHVCGKIRWGIRHFQRLARSPVLGRTASTCAHFLPPSGVGGHYWAGRGSWGRGMAGWPAVFCHGGEVPICRHPIIKAPRSFFVVIWSYALSESIPNHLNFGTVWSEKCIDIESWLDTYYLRCGYLYEGTQACQWTSWGTVCPLWGWRRFCRHQACRIVHFNPTLQGLAGKFAWWIWWKSDNKEWQKHPTDLPRPLMWKLDLLVNRF
jgi:hypothetical protein